MPPPPPPTAVSIIRNIGVVGTYDVTWQVWTPSIFHVSEPGAQISVYVCQFWELSLVEARQPGD